MIRYVIDASIVGPLIIPDERESLLSGLTDALADEECIVPPHWRFEVGNLGLSAARRKRADLDIILANLQDLARFTISTDLLSSELVWTRTMTLASGHRLSVYDAAYLELAQRMSLKLLSADTALLRAAEREGIPVDMQP